MSYDVISKIGLQLGIPGANSASGALRTVYSVAGLMALASLHDHKDIQQEERIEDEKSDPVSIQHFKKRIAQIFDAYAGISTEVASGLPKDMSQMLNEIYWTYLKSGFFYHSSYQISPAAPAAAESEGMVLRRGMSPNAELYMSGLGPYSEKKHDTNRTVSDMFCLQKQSFEGYLEELLNDGEWMSDNWTDDAKFLRLTPPFSGEYWQHMPYKDGRVSLARFGTTYVFYRYADGKWQQKPIPDWRIKMIRTGGLDIYGEYRRIAVALLKRYDRLPSIRADVKGDIVTIDIGYRLPPSEETFYKLYSWPVQYKDQENFKREMSQKVYAVFKKEMEAIGYRIEEA